MVVVEILEEGVEERGIADEEVSEVGGRIVDEDPGLSHGLAGEGRMLHESNTRNKTDCTVLTTALKHVGLPWLPRNNQPTRTHGLSCAATNLSFFPYVGRTMPKMERWQLACAGLCVVLLTITRHSWMRLT